MAPPKNKEKVKYINIRMPLSRFKRVQKVARSKGAPSPTEFCRDIVYKAIDEMEAA